MVRKILFLAATTALVSANAQNFNVDGHEAVDLGLSVLWATCNVGADSPEEAGDYFAWGETTTKTTYTTDNYTASDWTQALDADHDAATQNWSENWRMPSLNDFGELIKLPSEWVANYKSTGKCGRVFYKKKDGATTYDVNSDVHIFLPAAGSRSDKLVSENVFGFYWSCFKTNVNSKTMIYFYRAAPRSEDHIVTATDRPYFGFSVRPVCKKSVVTKLNYVEKKNANTVYKTFENGQIVIVKNGVKYNLVGKRL